MRLNPPLLALAAGAFGIGVTEFAPMGLLPAVAADLGVSIPAAGLLVSAYAIGVVLGAPLVTLTTGRVPRRALLIGLAAVFTLGNLLSAVSPGYALLLTSRLITSLNHGAFFGVGAVVAAGLVPPERKAAAVAAMFMGLTVATIVGVPLATWTGEQFGWRAAFWGIAGIGLLVMTALRLTLPRTSETPGGDFRAELRVLGRPSVLVALAMTVIAASAMFTVFTYIAPMLRTETRASAEFITAMLVVYGLGLTAGNWLGGRCADRSVNLTLIISLACLAFLLVLLAAVLPLAVPTAALIFLWGVASFALVPPLQVRVMAAGVDAPNLVSAMNIGAFNLGNALGAVLGGAVIAAGFGYRAVALAGAAAAATGLALVLALARREIHTRQAAGRASAVVSPSFRPCGRP